MNVYFLTPAACRKGNNSLLGRNPKKRKKKEKETNYSL
jgi:hypothetical protein